MRWTVEFEVRKTILIDNIKAEDEYEVEDIIAEMIENGEMNERDEFLNPIEDEYIIQATYNDEEE